MNYFEESLNIMNELYGHDVAMPLATVNDGKANLRVVDAYYNNKSFYITTYALSNKMKEIAINPYVAINHNLFIAHGVGKNIGNPLDENNKEIRKELRKAFCAFYDKHVNEDDNNTCILKIDLNDALVFAHNYKYVIDFKNKVSTREKYVIDIVF